jgi:hypothetical protein
MFLCLVAAMANSIASRRIDEVRASVLAQVMQRDYLDRLVEKAKSLESQYGSDCPQETSKAFQDIMAKESHRQLKSRNFNHLRFPITSRAR